MNTAINVDEVQLFAAAAIKKVQLPTDDTL